MTISEQSTNNESMRSDIYAVFAALMRSAPKEDVLDWLQGIEISEGADSQMSEAWTQLSLAAAIYSPQDIADEYQLLFIGIGRGEVMPFASWHLTGSLMEKPLALIRQDLERLGFERNEHTKEPEDHIAALCEVMSLLESEIEQNSFFNRHIQPWFEKLTVQIKQAEHAQFYAALANVMNQFLLIEQTRFARVSVRETKMIATEQ